jgi:hypothetical protein
MRANKNKKDENLVTLLKSSKMINIGKIIFFPPFYDEFLKRSNYGNYTYY